MVLAAVAISPVTQTWAARTWLERHGRQTSLHDLSASFGKVTVTKLHFENGGMVLDVPTLEAHLPIVKAATTKKIALQSLVARGWTLEFGRPVEPTENAETADAPDTTAAPSTNPATPPSAGAAPANAATTAAGRLPGHVPTPEEVLRLFHQVLGTGQFPFDLSLDGAELEGDLLLTPDANDRRGRMHIVITGGGLAVGHQGTFTVETTGGLFDTSPRAAGFSSESQLLIAMESPRTLSRVELKTSLSLSSGGSAESVPLAVDLAVERAGQTESYILDLSEKERHLLAASIRAPEAGGRLTGNWKVDLRTADLAMYIADLTLPTITAMGGGEFDADPNLQKVHAQGRLHTVTTHFGNFAPQLDAAGPVTVDTQVEATQSGRRLYIANVAATLAGAQPVANIHSLQSFEVDETTGAVTLSQPAAEWLEGAVTEFPLAWLPSSGAGFSLAGAASGAFRIRTENGAYILQPGAPMVGHQLTLARVGQPMLQGVDLSLPIRAQYKAGTWEIQSSPLTLTHDGRAIGTADITLARPAADAPALNLRGSWKADITSWGTPPTTLPATASAATASAATAPAVPARSAAGEFSATLGATTSLQGKVSVSLPDANETIATDFHADVSPRQQVSFNIPLKFTLGKNVSELGLEGSWYPWQSASELNVRLTSEDAEWENLRLLGAPLATLGGAAFSPGASGSSGAGPAVPVWGNLIGRVTVAFDRFKTQGREFDKVHGTLEASHRGLNLAMGSYTLPDHRLGQVEGELQFNAAAPAPYILRATWSTDPVSAAPLFGTTTDDDKVALHGKFSVAAKIDGAGKTPEEAFTGASEEYKFKSTGGFVRLLKTNIADALPEPTTPVSDAVGTMGSLVGKVFGRGKDWAGSGQIKLPKNTEAVITFTNLVSEFEYKEITLTATRGPDHRLRLTDLVLTSDEENITGSGEIDESPGGALTGEPLSIDLRIGVRGKLTDYLKQADLLSGEKDAQGYSLFKQEPFHFGGTLFAIDARQWHDVLAEAATRKPPTPPPAPAKDATKGK